MIYEYFSEKNKEANTANHSTPCNTVKGPMIPTETSYLGDYNSHSIKCYKTLILFLFSSRLGSKMFY